MMVLYNTCTRNKKPVESNNRVLLIRGVHTIKRNVLCSLKLKMTYTNTQRVFVFFYIYV